MNKRIKKKRKEGNEIMEDHKILYQSKSYLPKCLDAEYVEIYDHDFSIFGINEFEEFDNLTCTETLALEGKFCHKYDNYELTEIDGLTYLRNVRRNLCIAIGYDAIENYEGEKNLHVFWKILQVDTDSIHALPVLITTPVDLS